MTAATDHIVLQHLRTIAEELRAIQEERLEELAQPAAAATADQQARFRAAISRRFDRIHEHLDEIDRRLEPIRPP